MNQENKPTLRQIMRDKNITATQLAKLSGVNKGVLSTLLSGTYYTTKNTLRKLTDVLEVELSDINYEIYLKEHIKLDPSEIRCPLRKKIVYLMSRCTANNVNLAVLCKYLNSAQLNKKKSSCSRENKYNNIMKKFTIFFLRENLIHYTQDDYPFLHYELKVIANKFNIDIRYFDSKVDIADLPKYLVTSND